MHEELFVAIKMIYMEPPSILNVYDGLRFEDLVVLSSIIIMNCIDVGIMTVAGTRSPMWRVQLFDAGRCNFTHPATRATTGILHQK